MKATTFKIGDQITYSDDQEMCEMLGIEPMVCTGTIQAIYDNGVSVNESSNPYATLITEHSKSVIAKHIDK